jgi:hypothetical protein
MRIDKFETTIDGDKLVVYVEVPHEQEFQGIPRIRLETEGVVALLKEKGIKHGNCIQTAVLKNWREKTRKKTWIFEKKKLDKSSEKVILIKEEKPAPKKRESRAKKKTSK